MNLSKNPTRQQGAALLVSMIILLVMTMIILQGARSSNLEILIGSNSQSATNALIQAEDGVTLGEMFIEENYAGAPVIDYGEREDDGVHLKGQIEIESVDWTEMEPQVEKRGNKKHEYLLEYIGPSTAAGGSLSVGAGSASATRYLYRVSGRGESERGAARVVQTVYATAE